MCAVGSCCIVSGSNLDSRTWLFAAIMPMAPVFSGSMLKIGVDNSPGSTRQTKIFPFTFTGSRVPGKQYDLNSI